MNFVFASDSFKGSLSSLKIGELLTQAAKDVFPGCRCTAVPMADGGEGTAEAVILATGGKWVPVEVSGPLGEPVKAGYGLLPGGSAIIEMASASGLVLVPPEKRDPRNTSTAGTGELIAAALKAGCTELTIAIGGSATNDGGMGCARALGVRFLDASGRELEGKGGDLAKVASIDASGLLPAAKEAHFTVMSDVDNPLLGPDGATFTFGPQKGAVPEIRGELEAGMENYAAILKRDLGADTDFPGAGAAGGLGAGLKIFLNAEMRSGSDAVLDLIGFDALLKDADLVVTGEGRIDWQSAHGKVVSGVGKRCKKAGVPCIAIVGGMGDKAEEMLSLVDSIIPTVQGPCTLEYAMEHAEELYASAAGRVMRMLAISNAHRK
ncbi:MAG: glycerate kinase [Firmicutes bacterium]|nr:glycerate kinase [Bacillota bacterium]